MKWIMSVAIRLVKVCATKVSSKSIETETIKPRLYKRKCRRDAKQNLFEFHESTVFKRKVFKFLQYVFQIC